MSANSTVIAARLFRSQRYMVLLVVTVFVSLLIITSVFARDYVNMSSIPDTVSNYYQTVKGSGESSLLDFFTYSSGGEDDPEIENSQNGADNENFLGDADIENSPGDALENKESDVQNKEAGIENKESDIEKEEGAKDVDKENVKQSGETTTETTQELLDDSNDESKQNAAAEIPDS